MGRIGKTYPRVRSMPAPALEPAQGEGAGHLLGALVGILSALGLIGWLLTR